MRGLLHRLRSEHYLEDAAEPLLEALMDRIGAWLHEADIQAEVLRGLLHRRPQDGQGASVWFAVERSSTDGQQELRGSRSAWRWLRQARAAVHIEVCTGTALSTSGSSYVQTTALGEETQRRLQDREATHTFALPVQDERGQLVAMVSIELHAAEHLGEELPDWEEEICELEEAVLRLGPELLHLPLAPRDRQPPVPHVSDALRGPLRTLEMLARYREPVLLCGPSGSGKTSLARWMHHRSARAEGPFVRANLLGLASQMAGAQLFGWRRGAFTGAEHNRVGEIARAQHGTLFVDEVDKLAPDQQLALYRVLDDGIYQVLGGEEQQADVRFVFATNRGLDEVVAAGEFRQDLANRIAGYTVRLPPLAQRTEEIEAWAELFAQRMHAEQGWAGRVCLHPEAVALLRDQPWPDNLRGLRSTVTWAWMLAAEQPWSAEQLRLEPTHMRQALARRRRYRPSTARQLRRAAASLLDSLAEQELDPVALFRAYLIQAASEDPETHFPRLGLAGALRQRKVKQYVQQAQETIAAFEQRDA